MGVDEAGDVAVEDGLHLFHRIGSMGVLLAEIKCTLQQIVLNVFQKLRYVVNDAFEWLACLFFRVPTGHFDGAILQVALPQTEAVSLSYCTRMPRAFSSAISSAAFSLRASFGFGIGTMMTWIGASFGGSTRPSSSEWVMMRPPIRRVETPQLVAHTYSSLLFSFWNFTSKALAKFWPRLWLVPAWRALPSCIRASMV